jgi:Berberine and berberine like
VLFTAVQSTFDPLYPRGRYQAYWRARQLDELSDQTIDLLAARAADRPAPRSAIRIAHHGGTISNVPAEATAVAGRSAPFMVSIDGMWSERADNADQIAWVRSAWSEIAGPSGSGTDDDWERNLRRLAEVKAVYDPDNFFRINQNIAPAT